MSVSYKLYYANRDALGVSPTPAPDPQISSARTKPNRGHGCCITQDDHVLPCILVCVSGRLWSATNNSSLLQQALVGVRGTNFLKRLRDQPAQNASWPYAVLIPSEDDLTPVPCKQGRRVSLRNSSAHRPTTHELKQIEAACCA